MVLPVLVSGCVRDRAAQNELVGHTKIEISLVFQASRHIGDLFQDLRDGHNLISLLEVLSGEHLVSFILFLFESLKKK